MNTAILVVRRLPDYLKLEPSAPRDMVGAVRRTNAGVMFTVPGRGEFLWEGSMLTRVSAGTFSRYVIEEVVMDDITLSPTYSAPAPAPVNVPMGQIKALGASRDDLEAVDPAVEAAILTALEGCSRKMREIQEVTRLADDVLRPALTLMKRSGKLATTGQTRGTRYSVA